MTTFDVKGRRLIGVYDATPSRCVPDLNMIILVTFHYKRLTNEYPISGNSLQLLALVLIVGTPLIVAESKVSEIWSCRIVTMSARL